MKARWIVLTWMSLVPTAVHAQAAEAGERVRVRTIDRAHLVGTFVEMTSTELDLSFGDTSVRVPLAEVLTLERSLGERRRFGRNFLITTGVGALAFGILTAATDDDRCNDQPFGCLDGGGAFIVGSIVGGIISVPVGLIVGLTARSERWERVTLAPPAGVSLTLASMGAGRVSFGASVPLGFGRPSRSTW